MSFQQLLLILKARRKIVLIAFSTAVGAAVAISLILPKQYSAVATVLVDIKSSDPIYGAIMQAQLLPGYLATQVEIIGSDRVAQRVVKLLGLESDPKALARWRNTGHGQGTPVSYFARELQRKLEVKPSRESSIISIRFTAPEADRAAKVANAFAQAYIETNVELQVEPAKQYAVWFGDRTKQLRDELEAAQNRLSAYQRENGIVAADDKLDVENARYADLSGQLTMMQALRAESSSRNRQASGRTGVSPDVMNNPVIQSLRGDVVRAEAKLKELAGQLGSNHPQYRSAQAEVETLKEKLNTEMRQTASTVGANDAVMRERESAVRAALDAQKKKVLALKDARGELSVLQKDVENAQHAYDMVGQRLSQTSLQSQTQQTNVVLLAEAEPPIKHSSPKGMRNVAAGCLLGMLFGIGGAILLELRRPRVRSARDLAEALQLAVLVELDSARPASTSLFRLGRA